MQYSVEDNCPGFKLVWNVCHAACAVRCLLLFLISFTEVIKLYGGRGLYQSNKQDIYIMNHQVIDNTTKKINEKNNVSVCLTQPVPWSVNTMPDFLSWKYNIPKLPKRGLGVLNSCGHVRGWEKICATWQLSTGSSAFKISHPNCIIPIHWSLTDLERIIHIQLTAAIFTSHSNAWFYSLSHISNPFKSKAISNLTKLSDIAIESVREKSWPCTLMTNSKSENGQKSRACLLGRNKGGLSLSSWTLLSPCGSVIEKGQPAPPKATTEALTCVSCLTGCLENCTKL